MRMATENMAFPVHVPWAWQRKEPPWFLAFNKRVISRSGAQIECRSLIVVHPYTSFLSTIAGPVKSTCVSRLCPRPCWLPCLWPLPNSTNGLRKPA